MAIEKALKNARVIGNNSFAIKQYIPPQYSERQKQYFLTETRLFTEQAAKYATDYIEVLAQGLNPAEPFAYTKVHMRLSDIVRSSSAISYEFDNYKMVDIAERQYQYLRIGAKIIAMGSTWLVINPDNMGNVLGKSIIQRCDAVWHYLDYYGNVCAEPMCFDRRLAKANDSDAQRATMITKGYFDCKVQYNEATKQLFTNSRIILGSSVYRITGYSDFIQEFTEDVNSVNLLQFDVRYEEPNDAIDDMENRVAGGKTFAWDINVLGTPTIMAGEAAQLTAASTRTAEEKTEIVTSTEEHPIYYLWESSDESVATVGNDGLVTAVSEGEATITCTLAQNQNKTQTYTITVAGSVTEPHISYTSTIPDTLGMFKTVTISAEYYENGQPTGNEITYSFSGADENAYTATVKDGNTVDIKCWGGSVRPLEITASYGDISNTVSLYLEGI